MTDDLNLPGVDKPAEAIAETAKFGQEIVTLVKASGEWASAVLGTLPHNVVGILGDEVSTYRANRAIDLREGVIRRLRARGHKAPEDLSAPPSLLLPILNLAIDEDRIELQNLWEKLLAAASDPDRKNQVRRSFINLISQLDPADALALQTASIWTGKLEFKGSIVENTGLDLVEADVSFERLRELGLIGGRGGGMKSMTVETSGYHVTSLAKSFLKAVSD